MKFSIITPCLNSEKTIRKTMESILNQTYEDYEYIIIDGGSKDCTLEIIDSYEQKFGEKLHIISESDHGIYDAMNKGIRISSGDLIGIVNSDDYYEIDCLENINKSYSEKNGKYQILYGAMRCLDESGDIISEVFYHHNYLEHQMINHPATFVTKKLYDELGIYDEKYLAAADLDFLLRMKKNENVVFVPLYKILTNFMSGGMSGTYTGAKETLMVKYENRVISTKIYLLNCLKIWIKKTLQV